MKKKREKKKNNKNQAESRFSIFLGSVASWENKLLYYSTKLKSMEKF